jgi:hypothetical protein
MKTSTYLQINAKYSNPILFSLTDRGFYSEINNLLNAILFGLVAKRRLCVDQSRFANGCLIWSDLFKSQLPWSNGDIPMSIDPLSVISGVESDGFGALRHLIMSWHRKRKFFLSRSYGFYRNVFTAKRHLARQLCQPATHPEWPGSLQVPYAAIHVRRGDKLHGYIIRGNLIVEGEDTPFTDYLSFIRRKAPNLRSLFVMTDDYRVVEDLRSIDPGLDIFTFCQKAEHGYNQVEFNSLGARTKTILARRLISEVGIACNSQMFVGCYRSNVSRYIALTHDHPSQCYSVDGVKSWDPS